jgi:hypothetical protein
MTLEELAKTFKKHHEDLIEYEKEMLEKHPEMIRNEFCLANALRFICEEIILLKSKVK